MIGQAQTGTGKTAAFGLPMIEFVDPDDPDVQALVLTPTRELCIQVTQALRAYGERRGISVVAVFGGAPIRDQASRLKESAQVVVGTVGRVMDMIGRHYLFLDSARYVVLDEADEMLDLVEHEVAARVQHQRVARDQVEHTADRADHDLPALLEPVSYTHLRAHET